MVDTRSWFEGVDASKPVSEKEIETLAKIFEKSIEKGKFFPGKTKLNDNTQRLIFLGVIRDGVPITYFSGYGEGILAAAEMAFAKLTDRFDLEVEEIMLKMDIVSEYRSIEDVYEDYSYDLIKGLEGIAFSHVELAIMPEPLAYNRLINEKGDLSYNKTACYLESEPFEASKFSQAIRKNKYNVYVFKTEGYLLEGESFTKLIRGQYFYESLDKETIKNSIELSAYYLKNCVNSYGRFDYLYNADNNYSTKDYGALRHAGTLFSMIEYYECFKDKSILPEIELALDYLDRFFVPGIEDPNTLCLLERGSIKLGGNGLAVLAVAKYIIATKDKSRIERLEKMADWMLTQLNEDGSFKGHKQYYPRGNYSDTISDYYPGEVIYGLMLANKVIPNKKWVKASDKIANWLINVRDKNVAVMDLQHDHWLLYSFNELYRLSPDPAYIEHATKIVTSIINKQNLDVKYPDYHGSYYKGDPRSTPAATRSEGLIATFKLIRDFGKDKELAKKILDCAMRTLCFQIRMQYNELTSSYLAYQDKAYGGFRGSIDLHDIRIDYNQHSMSSLIAMYQLLKK